MLLAVNHFCYSAVILLMSQDVIGRRLEQVVQIGRRQWRTGVSCSSSVLCDVPVAFVLFRLKGT